MRLVPFLALVSLAGCNALLGIESGAFAPSEIAPDGAAPTDSGSAHDGPTADVEADPCVDLTKNPHHCGACGHTCFGGECVESQCRPYVLTREPGGDLFGIAVGADSVFVQDAKSSSIREVPLAGGPSTLFHADPALTPTKLTVHGDFLYFLEGGAVVRCPVASCADAPETVVPAVASTWTTFAVDASGDIAFAAGGPGAAVGRCIGVPCRDGNAPRSIATTENRPANIAISGSTIAWTLFGAGAGDQSLRQSLFLGADPKTVATGNGILSLAMTKDEIVYDVVNGANQSIVVTSFDGLGRRTIGSPLYSAAFLVIDGDAVLYPDTYAHAVVRVPLDGSTPPVAIATEQARPGAIAVDATSFYWVNDAETLVRRAR